MLRYSLSSSSHPSASFDATNAASLARSNTCFSSGGAFRIPHDERKVCLHHFDALINTRS